MSSSRVSSVLILSGLLSFKVQRIRVDDLERSLGQRWKRGFEEVEGSGMRRCLRSIKVLSL